MNFEKFRSTGELSDTKIVVEQREFDLHSFPLFVESRFFKRKFENFLAPPFFIDFAENFPAGAENFEKLADLFYSVDVSIDELNVVPLRLGAEFLEAENFSARLDEKIVEFFNLAQGKNDVHLPLDFLVRSASIDRCLAEKTTIVRRSIEFFQKNFSKNFDEKIRKNFSDLPLDWIIQIVEMFEPEGRVALLPLIETFLDRKFSDQTENFRILDELLVLFGENLQKLSLNLLISIYEKSIEVESNFENFFFLSLFRTFLNESKNEIFQKISDETLAKILERIHQDKNQFVNDPETLEKLTILTENYLDELQQRENLTDERMSILISSIPGQSRPEVLRRILDEILKEAKTIEMPELDREDLINQIDFSEFNDETMKNCRKNKNFAQKLIGDGALSLCAQLRVQLDEIRVPQKLFENEKKTDRISSRSSSFRYRPVESFPRLVNRSRSQHSSIYDQLRKSSTSSRSETDSDLDFLLPDRFLSSGLKGRISRFYSIHRS